MTETPVNSAFAFYRGRWIEVHHSSNEWLAINHQDGVEYPDALQYGFSHERFSPPVKWVKVPRSSIGGIIHRRVLGTILGHTVSLSRRLPNGLISVSFIGSLSAAKEIGLTGDQYMGWTGTFSPEDFESIDVKETRRE